jgi:5-methylcytosine-specific restriction endonuclease McrA
MRVNLLRGHGSPTNFLYRLGCRCASCRRAKAVTARGYYGANRDSRVEYTRRWIEDNPEYHPKYRHENVEGIRRWYVDHKDEVRDAGRCWRADHPERAAESRRLWREANPEKRAASHRNRRARKLAAGGAHTAADVAAQYERQHGRCYYCRVQVGMAYHVDHVIPLILGGSNGPENLVVACPACNLAKHARNPQEFAGILC